MTEYVYSTSGVRNPESRVRAGLKGSAMRAGDLWVEHPSASYGDFQEKAISLRMMPNDLIPWCCARVPVQALCGERGTNDRGDAIEGIVIDFPIERNPTISQSRL